MSRISFGGLASGLDTNTLIKQLIQLEREPIEKKEKKILELERVRDAWRDINMRLYNLRTLVQELRDRNNFLTLQATSSEPSAVSATVKNKATQAVYEIQISQLATQHTVAMQGSVDDLLGKSTTEYLGFSGSFQIKDLRSGSFKEIQVTPTDSLNSLKNKINGAQAGVTASIIAGHLILKSSLSGVANSIELAYLTGDDVLDELALYDTAGATFYNETVAARDAHFNLNGINFVRSSNEVSDLIENVTFHLHGVTTGPAQLQIGADTELAISVVREFVGQFNSVNHFIRERLEKPNEEIRDASRGLLQGNTTLMKIERTLRTLVNSPVANYRYQDEEGNWQQKKYYALASLGVTTIDKEGYLQFDERKLVAALEDDPEGVFAVLQFEYLDEHGVGTRTYGGVAVELDNYLKRLLQAEQDSQGRLLRPISRDQEAAVQRRIDELRRRIQIREERLLRYEERLVRQFTALEKHIATMQSQSQEMENMIRQFVGFGHYNRRN